jgi:hypothetical protein
MSIYAVFAIMWTWRQTRVSPDDGLHNKGAGNSTSPDAACGWEAITGSVSGNAQVRREWITKKLIQVRVCKNGRKAREYLGSVCDCTFLIGRAYHLRSALDDPFGLDPGNMGAAADASPRHSHHHYYDDDDELTHRHHNQHRHPNQFI